MSIFLKIGDRLDAQVVLGVVLYNKHGNIFKEVKNSIFNPRTRGLKKWIPLFYGKDENYASRLFDSLNEAL